MRSRATYATHKQRERHEQRRKAGDHGELPVARHDEGIHHRQKGDEQEDNERLANFPIHAAGDTVNGDEDKTPVLRDAAEQKHAQDHKELVEDLLELEAVEH